MNVGAPEPRSNEGGGSVAATPLAQPNQREERGPYPPGSVGAWMWAGLGKFVEKHRG